MTKTNLAEQRTQIQTSGAGKTKYYAVENVNKSNTDKVIIGNFDLSSKQPAQGSFEAEIKPGTYTIPNYSLVWGKKIYDSKDKSLLTGECLFDKAWGEGEGYEAVEIQYARNSNSILKAYHQAKNIKLKDEDMHIEVSSEISYVNEQVEPAKALFLKTCSLNKSSICRNPEAGVLLQEYDPNNIVNREIDDFEMQTKAMQIVLDAKNNTEVANILADMLLGDSGIGHEDIIKSLMLKMKSNPSKFLKTIEDTISYYESMLHKAKQYGIIGIEKDGLIQVKSNGGYDILFQDVEATEDKKISWMVSNFMIVEFYDKIVEVSKLVSDFEKQN